ncbi:MAG: FG-GAP repeat protein, partial [Alphaproteobacteria bacterium]|nr:FG-GAP repeat protein [Alphaproteobacteria bacterium]
MARLAPIVGIALLGACDPAPQADGPSRAALLQVGTAPTLTLSVRVAAPGDRITFDAAGLQPGARVALVYTDGYEVPDAGPCPPMLGGGCLDITTLSQLGSFRLPDADATGRSSISARVPAAVPVGAHAFQLVTHPAAGPWQEGGTASLEVLPASCFTVEPTDTGLSPSGYPDGDGDGVPDRCDTCPDGDDFADADVDGVADACDACPGALDSLDADGDGAPDACDRCPSGDDRLDDDTDGVPDACDVCPGFDDAADADLDTVADGCDPCPLDAPDDADGDGVCSTDEVTLYGTDPFLVDSDFDGLDDGTEVALGTDPNNPDSDADGIDDGVEVRIFESDPTDPTIRSRQPDFVIRGDVDGALTGASASLIPDLNGDGLDEFLIGAPSLDSQDGTDVGRLYVVYGTLDDTEVDLAQVLAGQGGFAVTGTDGGFDMVNTLCADPQVNLNNTVCTIVPPTVDAMPSTHDWVDGAGLGAWVTSLGDFDGDGVGDFAASSPWARVDGRPGGGKVHLFSGATAATTTLADLEAGVPASGGFVEGNQGLQFFTGANRAVSDPDFTGFGITGGFDLNGDGLADLAVQSPLGRLSDPEQLITIVLGKEGRVAGKVTDVAAPDGF